MSLTPFTAGEQFLISPSSVTLDGETVADYTEYTWYCTVTKTLGGTSINGTINSDDDSDRFTLDATTLKILAVNETESSSLNSSGSGSAYNNQPIICTLYVDVWAVDSEGADYKVFFDTVSVLKGATETRD